MDRDDQLIYMEDFVERSDDELRMISRILERARQKSTFPYNPGDPLAKGEVGRYTSEQLLDGDYEDEDEDDYDDEPANADWEHQSLRVKTSSWYRMDIPTNTMLTVDDFKRAQDALIKADIPMAGFQLNIPSVDSGLNWKMTSLDCCANSAPVPCTAAIGNKRNSIKENTMYNERTYTESEKKADFLVGELENLYFNRENDSYNTFNMREQRPRDAKQAREWLAAGGLTIKGDDDQKYYSTFWNDPSKPRDQAGFDAYTKKLNDAYKDTLRTIKIAEPKDGLEALKAFETANLLAN